MSATIIEALMNAETNIDNTKRLGMAILPFAKNQLHNAIVLLDKGYDIYDEVDELLEEYGSVDNVPENQKTC